IPEEFKHWLSLRVEKNKRVASVELRAVATDWRAGERVPGYGTWRELWQQRFPEEPVPDFCPDYFVPEGWGERNLRNLLPGGAALTFARTGWFDAHGKMPQIRHDYRGLRPLEGIIFDDVKADWLVAVPGYTKACELWLLVAMDAATRVILDWVSLVAVPDDDGRRNTLLEEHMLILVGQLLLKHGIPSGYKSTLVIENAKATIRLEHRQLLAALSGGAIEVEPTRMVNRALPGGFVERHGTPWGMKALLESFFRTFHDHGAALPGQTGSLQVLNAPGELAAREKEHKALMQECADLPPEAQAQLRSTFLPHAEAIDAIEQIFRTLNARTTHRLQGFERVQVWRFPEDLAWRPLEELQRYGKADVARALFETRMESPLDRFDRLARLQPPAVPVPEDALIPFLAKTIKRVRHPAPYTLAHREAGAERVYRGDLPALASGGGGPFALKVLPHNIAVGYVYDESGRYIGAVALVHAPSPLDKSGQHRAIAEAQQYRQKVVQPVMDRHAPDREAEDARRERNAAIIAAARQGGQMQADATQATAAKAKADRATRERNATRARQMA
ncbi:MAG: hypothetical protein ACREIA_19635, partial [Opitutaceae bacterium]